MLPLLLVAALNSAAKEPNAVYAQFMPHLANARWVPLDLDAEARGLIRDRDAPNPLLDPGYCERWIGYLLRKNNGQYGFGGYGEDRAVLWNGSYIQFPNSVHLGVDFWVPAGNIVRAPFSSIVLDVLEDHSSHGWGGRLVLSTRNRDKRFLVAHLEFTRLLKVGQTLEQNEVIGRVGLSESNGLWAPHIHVQAVPFFGMGDDDFEVAMDGYGGVEDLPTYPDPITYLKMQADQ